MTKWSEYTNPLNKIAILRERQAPPNDLCFTILHNIRRPAERKKNSPHTIEFRGMSDK